MNDQIQLYRNALAILAKSSSFYVEGLDDLAKNFVAPQVNAASRILAELIDAVTPPSEETPPTGEAETVEAETPATPANSAKK